jgi:8-oxo-dGTP diphosphatase
MRTTQKTHSPHSQSLFSITIFSVKFDNMLPRHSISKKPSGLLSRYSTGGKFQISLLFNILFLIGLFKIVHESIIDGASSSTSETDLTMMIRGDEMTWHGGYPVPRDHKGTCWCTADEGYCSCTPNVSVDLIMANENNTHVWLVRRKDNDLLGNPGGFLNVGETVEQAMHRELREEMNIVLDAEHEKPKLLGVYSDPKRDPRRANTAIAFVVRLTRSIEPKAADDAKDVLLISLDDIEKYEYFADHKTILFDYRNMIKGSGGKATSGSVKALVGDIKSTQRALEINRAVCSAKK